MYTAQQHYVLHLYNYWAALRASHGCGHCFGDTRRVPPAYRSRACGPTPKGLWKHVSAATYSPSELVTRALKCTRIVVLTGPNNDSTWLKQCSGPRVWLSFCEYYALFWNVAASNVHIIQERDWASYMYSHMHNSENTGSGSWARGFDYWTKWYYPFYLNYVICEGIATFGFATALTLYLMVSCDDLRHQCSYHWKYQSSCKTHQSSAPPAPHRHTISNSPKHTLAPTYHPQQQK